MVHPFLWVLGAEERAMDKQTGVPVPSDWVVDQAADKELHCPSETVEVITDKVAEDSTSALCSVRQDKWIAPWPDKQ